MRLVLAGLLAASTLAVAAPAFAQGGALLGPGIALGINPTYRDRYDYSDGPIYQGRSVHRDRVYRDRAYRDGYDQYDDDRDDLDGF